MAASVEERRPVTILFADVTGSTALGEELETDDEEVRVGALRWLSRAARVAAATGAKMEAERQLREALGIATDEERPSLEARLSEVAVAP